MKFAFNTWAYSSFPTWLPTYTVEDTIRRLAGIGWTAIEIGCASPLAYPPFLSADRRKEIRDILDGEGVSLVAMLPAPGGGPGCNPCSPVAEERAFTIRHYGQVINLAADLGAETVLYIPGWVAVGSDPKRAFDQSREALGKIADHAAERGLRIAVEPTTADSNLINTAADAIRLMRAVDRPNVKLMFDTCHVFYAGEDCVDYVREMGTDLIHIHAAEKGRAAIGDGEMDWKRLFDALEAQGFDGYFTVEAGFASRDVDPDEVARKSLAEIRRLLMLS